MTDFETKNLLKEALRLLSLQNYRNFELRADGDVYFREMIVPKWLVDEMGIDLACVVMEDPA